MRYYFISSFFLLYNWSSSTIYRLQSELEAKNLKLIMLQPTASRCFFVNLWQLEARSVSLMRGTHAFLLDVYVFINSIYILHPNKKKAIFLIKIFSKKIIIQTSISNNILSYCILYSYEFPAKAKVDINRISIISAFYLFIFGFLHFF